MVVIDLAINKEDTAVERSKEDIINSTILSIQTFSLGLDLLS